MSRDRSFGGFEFRSIYHDEIAHALALFPIFPTGFLFLGYLVLFPEVLCGKHNREIGYWSNLIHRHEIAGGV